MENLVVVSGKQSTDDYPYGRLKCTMTFDVEFKANKGFRFVTQSIDPKTLRLNAPKASIYSSFMVLTKDSTNGHFGVIRQQIGGSEDIETVINIISQYQIELPAEQREYIYIKMIGSLGISYAFNKPQFNNDRDLFKSISKLKAILQLFKENAPLIELTKIGFSAENVNSFKFVSNDK